MCLQKDVSGIRAKPPGAAMTTKVGFGLGRDHRTASAHHRLGPATRSLPPIPSPQNARNPPSAPAALLSADLALPNRLPGNGWPLRITPAAPAKSHHVLGPYSSWSILTGCSVQSHPKANTSEFGTKVGTLKTQMPICPLFSGVVGGAEGNRTPDLVIANDALSQLSYGPNAVVSGRSVASCQAGNVAR